MGRRDAAEQLADIVVFMLPQEARQALREGSH
jgi:hypothetical protein